MMIDGIKVERISEQPKKRMIRSKPEDKPVVKMSPSAATKARKDEASTNAMKSGDTTMENAILENFPWNAEAIAEELNMPLPSFRSWKIKVEKEKKIAKPAIGSLLCIVDPHLKTRLRYSDSYVDKLRSLRGTVQTRKEVAPSAMQHAKLKLSIAIFDENIAKFLMKKFKDEKGVEEYMKTHLRELVLPTLSKIEELKRKFEQEMAELMES